MMNAAKRSGFQRFLSLTVSFMLIFPVTSYAKRKKYGSRIIVTKIDARIIDGELLKVGDSGIIIMSGSETGVTIPLHEIKKVELTKKGKFLGGFLVGMGVSIIACGIISRSMEECDNSWAGAIFWGIPMGVTSGTVLGGITSTWDVQKTYNFESASTEELHIILNKLRSKARF